MSMKRKSYSPQFKAKVALTALKNVEPVAELAARFEVHSTMINSWKRSLFDKGQKTRKQIEAKVDDLYRQIGQLKVENDFLGKKLSL